MAQDSPVGIWKNVDDEDGKVKSHIEIYEQDGKLRARIHKILENATQTICTACKGEMKNKPFLGMDIMWDMEHDEDMVWSGGRIFDARKGKEYKCKITLEEPNLLIVRGYVGMPAFGRSQEWYRLVE